MDEIAEEKRLDAANSITVTLSEQVCVGAFSFHTLIS
jgi:hypothetical protein